MYLFGVFSFLLVKIEIQPKEINIPDEIENRTKKCSQNNDRKPDLGINQYIETGVHEKIDDVNNIPGKFNWEIKIKFLRII